eukprot:1889067-Prymnesium_polylepis.1
MNLWPCALVESSRHGCRIIGPVFGVFGDELSCHCELSMAGFDIALCSAGRASGGGGETRATGV